MKNIAFVTFAPLPLPNSKGGAIETLITNLIDENEKYRKLNLTIYSIFDDKAYQMGQKYKKCRCVFINSENIKVKVTNLFGRLIQKLTKKKIKYVSHFMRQVISDINKNSFDYVIVWGGGILVPQFASKIKAKLIMYYHTDPLFYLTKDKIKEIDSCAEKIFCVSEFVALQAESTKSKTFVIKNCTDLQPLKIDERKKYRNEIRKKFNINEDDNLLLFCGRLDPIKGVRELLCAFNKITVPNTKLMIIGSSWSGIQKKSQYVIELEQLAKTIDKDIIFTGYVNHEELPKFYASVDISVVPTTCKEAAGLTVIESVAMGIAIIATNLGGIPEYCDSNNAVLINYKKETFVDELTLALESLLNDETKRRALTQNDKIYYKSHNTESFYFSFVNQIEKG